PTATSTSSATTGGCPSSTTTTRAATGSPSPWPPCPWSASARASSSPSTSPRKCCASTAAPPSSPTSPAPSRRSRSANYLSLDLGPLYTPDAALFRDVLGALRRRRRALIRYRSLSSGRTTARSRPPLPRLQPEGRLVPGRLGRDPQDHPPLRDPSHPPRHPQHRGLRDPAQLRLPQVHGRLPRHREGLPPGRRRRPLRPAAGPLDPRAQMAP